MDSIFHPRITLIEKNGTWVPKKQKLMSALDHRGLELKQILGEGAFAKVKLAFSQKEKKDVAVKMFDKRRLPFDYLKKFLPREIKVLHLLQHPHLITLRDVFETSSYVYMVMDYAVNGDLLDCINQDRYQNEAQVQRHFQQIVSGLSAIHERLIVHRDLKCENILLDAKNNIKIGDFGFARLVSVDTLVSTQCGSLAYSAPELVGGASEYSGFLTDCWSLGIIMYCMVCRKLPYEQHDLIALSKGKFYKVKELEFPGETCKDIIMIVNGLLEVNPLKRFNCVDLKKTDWCKGYHVITPKNNDKEIEMSCDFIGAKTTVATSTQPQNTSNILSDTIRPNYHRTFYKAIKRQRANIFAINAFKNNKIKAVNSENDVRRIPSCVLSQSVLTTPQTNRRFSLLGDLKECERDLIKEKRNQVRSTVNTIKDVNIQSSRFTNKSKYVPCTNSRNTPISHDSYEDFLIKKKQEKEKELHSITRSHGSRVARNAKYQKQQFDKQSREHWFEAETGNDQAQEEWLRKCILSCSN